MKRTVFVLTVAALIASGPAFAQQSQPTQPTATTQPNQSTPTIGERRQDQQDRIANGIDSGQLTAGETRNLESREANVNREIRDDRAGDNGHLTAAERRQIAGLQPKRAEVILAGACIVRTVMDKLGKSSLSVSDRGLRHGLLIDRFGSRPLAR